MISTVNLNTDQNEAVMDESQACLVNAQVGSGKTTVLIAKVFYLHHIKGVSLQDMAVFTFTNKAANEIKGRLKAVDTGIPESALDYFGTFHSIALKMLKTLAPLDSIGYSKDFSVIDAEEKTDMVSALIHSNGLNIRYLNKLEKRLEDAAKGCFLYGNMKCQDDMEALWRLYASEKRIQGKMDFDDLILNITKLLPQIKYRPKWIIVDEFQDTDDSQMSFIRALASPETKLFVVGDPNQIIYSWRGSNRQIFETFAEEYNARRLSLPKNYRSCTTILDVAKCFLNNDDKLYGTRELGGKIKVSNHYNAFNEAQYIALSILEKAKEGQKYGDIAVFYRLQRQSQPLEDVFQRNNIPYEVSIKKTIKDIPVLKWVILLLRASVNPLDIESAVYALSDEQFGERFSKSSARKIVRAARNTANTSAIRPEKQARVSTESDHLNDSVLLSRIDGFEDWCKSNSDLEAVYDYYSFDSYINPTSSSFSENKKSIIALLKKIATYIRTQKLDLFAGTKDFINSSALYSVDVLTENGSAEADTVKLMTLHSCKGLEFKQVYIIGVNDGLIPLFAKDNEEEQEERRLFFVGITRAKDALELSYYTNPETSRVLSGPSRYLQLIPPRLVDAEVPIKRVADLQYIRHEITERKNCDDLKASGKQEDILQTVHQRAVCHPKYGIGIVIKEDENLITVFFDGYGEKEFVKAFSDLEDIVPS